MHDTLEDDLRRAFARVADALPDDVDLPAASSRRRRRRVISRGAVAVVGVAVLACGLVASQIWDEPHRTATGSGHEGGPVIPITLPDGHDFTVDLPAGAGSKPAVTTRGWIGLDGCCGDAVVYFEPATAGHPLTRTAVPTEDLGAWTTSTGLRLHLQRVDSPLSGSDAVTAATSGAPDLLENYRMIVGEVGDYRLTIAGLTISGLDLPTAHTATDHLAIAVGPGGYPIIGRQSRRGPYMAGPEVTSGPGVIVIPRAEPDRYGTSARLDLGNGRPSVLITPSDCTDRVTTTMTTTAVSPVAVATRCFPDAGVLAIVTQTVSTGGHQAAVTSFTAALHIDP